MKLDIVDTYLARKCDWRLIQSLLLWVPDVGRDDFVERKPVVLLLQLVAKNLRLDRELTADSILNLLKSRVKHVQRELAHCS